MRRRMRRNILGRADSDNGAAANAALRPHVNHPVGQLDHIEIVFDDDECVSLIDEPLQHTRKFPDVVEMQSRRRFVHDVQLATG